jgi:hypothetical protein
MPTFTSVIYQLKVVLQDISPMIWRRLLVCGDSAITDLHYILQIAMGWSDDHLHQFRIHEKRYGIARMGGIWFSDDPDTVRLEDFHFRINERFLYEYDFTDNWQHHIRVENILTQEPRRCYPVCISGRRACPPEDYGDPLRFMALRQHYCRYHIMERLLEIIESDGGDTKAVEKIACLECGMLRPVELGLTLDEAKDLLESMQHTVVEQQVAEYLEQQAHCPCCGKKRRRKGHHNPIVYRTLFGKLRLPSMRFFHCECQLHANRTFSPLTQLLTERTSSELLYLETKFASLMSYGLTVNLLQEILPIGNTINAATVRNKVHDVSRRIDKELGEERAFFIDGCENDWELKVLKYVNVR